MKGFSHAFLENGQQLQCMIADECAPRTQSTCLLDWLSTTVFVCSVVYVHDLTRHRALTSLHADTCGFVRGGFLFCLWKRVLAAVSSCSCLWQDFAIARNVSSNLLHVCLCTSRERHFEVRVKHVRCF